MFVGLWIFVGKEGRVIVGRSRSCVCVWGRNMVFCDLVFLVGNFFLLVLGGFCYVNVIRVIVIVTGLFIIVSRGFCLLSF